MKIKVAAAFSFVLTTGLLLAYFCKNHFHLIKARIAPCEWNLMTIRAAELNWANRERKTVGAIPNWDDLREDLERHGWTNGRPVCPQGGTYILSPIGEDPKCSIGGRDHYIPKKVAR